MHMFLVDRYSLKILGVKHKHFKVNVMCQTHVGTKISMTLAW